MLAVFLTIRFVFAPICVIVPLETLITPVFPYVRQHRKAR
jgi:hypothetical protein